MTSQAPHSQSRPTAPGLTHFRLFPGPDGTFSGTRSRQKRYWRIALLSSRAPKDVMLGLPWGEEHGWRLQL